MYLCTEYPNISVSQADAMQVRYASYQSATFHLPHKVSYRTVLAGVVRYLNYGLYDREIGTVNPRPARVFLYTQKQMSKIIFQKRKF
jgi:hypothetical protein